MATVKSCVSKVKVAVTDLAVSIVKVMGLFVVEIAPVQPVKVEFGE